jgi:hypothetical protein
LFRVTAHDALPAVYRLAGVQLKAEMATGATIPKLAVWLDPFNETVIELV